MKLGFNEANDRFCANHSVMMDLELCEKYGFDCIDIQSECLNRDLEAGKITLEEMGAWFQSHHLKMLSYNALCFFNMKQTQGEKAGRDHPPVQHPRLQDDRGRTEQGHEGARSDADPQGNP